MSMASFTLAANLPQPSSFIRAWDRQCRTQGPTLAELCFTAFGDKILFLCSLCKYMMVASGRTSVFLLRARAQTIIKAWDHAVGIICVCESGGKVTDWKGNQLNFALDQVERRIIFPSGGVLVTNGNLHDELLELITV